MGEEVNSEHLNGKEIIVLNLLSGDSLASQRQISGRTGFSLGLVNSTIKNLIRAGFLKVAKLNSKKLRYLLTEEGSNLHARRSYNLVVSAIRQYQQIREQLQKQLIILYNQGHTDFILHGNQEISEVIRPIIQEELSNKVSFRTEASPHDEKSILLKFFGEKSPPDFKGQVVEIRLEVQP